MIFSPTPAKGEFLPNRILPSATAEAGRPLQIAGVGTVRRHISAEELSIHISAIAAKADQARACGDRHGAHLYALQMVDAVKDHYRGAAREQRWLDEGPDYFSVQGALAREGLAE